MTHLKEDQHEFISTLEDTFTIIQKTHISMKNYPQNKLTEGYVKARLKSLEDYWITYKQAHSGLVKCTPRELKGRIAYFRNEDYFKCEELYHSLQGELNDILFKIRSQRRQEKNDIIANTSQNRQQALTKEINFNNIDIPLFNGSLADWPTFHDSFVTLIHQKSFSNETKLQYLKKSVSDEAESVVNISYYNNNYTQAWASLKERYGNKNNGVTSFLRKLCDQNKMDRQSKSDIKSILDTTTQCINSINKWKINTESWDPIIVYLVSQKIDTETLKDWEKHVQKNDRIATWNEIKGFLETKFNFRTIGIHEFVSPTPPPVSRFLTTCPHIGTLDKMSVNSRYTKDMECIFCNNKNTNSVCLHCNIIACSRYDKGHMQAHYFTTGHPFVLSLERGDIWCSPCHAFLENRLFDEYKQRLAPAAHCCNDC